MERRPLNHAVVSSMPRTKAERVAAAAKLAPLPERVTPRVSPSRVQSANDLTCWLKNLSSPSEYVKKQAEREVLALPAADRQRLYAALGRVKQSNGLPLAYYKVQATSLRLSAPKRKAGK